MPRETDTSLPARLHPSPNHNERDAEARIDMLVLHYTGMESGEAALRRLCDARAQVSAHYLVEEDGTLFQCVPESRRGWHAGVSSWKGRGDLNSCSIGVEIVNPGHEHGYRPFPERQIEAVVALSQDICRRHEIPAERVLAHSDIAPERKQDPGELFPWDWLAAEGVGHFVEPIAISGGRYFQYGEEGQPIEALQSMLAIYGYDVAITGVFDERTRAAVAAFQRHFRREKVDGIADMSTISTLHRLISALPSFG